MEALSNMGRKSSARREAILASQRFPILEAKAHSFLRSASSSSDGARSGLRVGRPFASPASTPSRRAAGIRVGGGHWAAEADGVEVNAVSVVKDVTWEKGGMCVCLCMCLSVVFLRVCVCMYGSIVLAVDRVLARVLSRCTILVFLGGGSPKCLSSTGTSLVGCAVLSGRCFNPRTFPKVRIIRCDDVCCFSNGGFCDFSSRKRRSKPRSSFVEESPHFGSCIFTRASVLTINNDECPRRSCTRLPRRCDPTLFWVIV